MRISIFFLKKQNLKRDTVLSVEVWRQANDNKAAVFQYLFDVYIQSLFFKRNENWLVIVFYNIRIQ